MKNIHILPTDKPSRLFTANQKLVFDNENLATECIAAQSIYITSDEEIKEGDWGYCKSRNKICKVTGISKWTHKDDYSIDLDNENYFIHHSYCKKIILTTDTDLIKDGVQAIDDEFLEWFVKNPSCEEVEVQKWFDGVDFLEYKIIIPKEEPKQETTLEEAALNFSKQFLNNGENSEYEAQAALIGVKFGANWQAEQDKNKYSEEEVDVLIYELINKFTNWSGSYVYNDKLIEIYKQFKKKA